MTADEYHTNAEEMRKCAERAHTDDERMEYLKLAKAWQALANAAARGIEPEAPCDED